MCEQTESFKDSLDIDCFGPAPVLSEGYPRWVRHSLCPQMLLARDGEPGNGKTTLNTIQYSKCCNCRIDTWPSVPSLAKHEERLPREVMLNLGLED